MAALASDWLRHFRLLLWNRWTEFNETWQEARSQRPLPSLCFSGRSEKQDGRPGLWLAETFSTSPLKPLNGIQQNLIGSKISTSSTKFVFFRPIGKTRWPPWPLIGWGIFDFSTETAEQNSTKLDKKQDLNVLYHVCVFGPIWKTRWPPWPLIGWDIFDFSSETAERNSMKLDRKQDLNVLYQFCVFSGWSEKQGGRPGLWLAETFSTSPLKLLNGIQRNLTRSKISMSSTNFVFFRLISNQKCLPWQIPQKGGTLYSGARYVALWASCLQLYACAIRNFYCMQALDPLDNNRRIRMSLWNTDGNNVQNIPLAGIFGVFWSGSRVHEIGNIRDSLYVMKLGIFISTKL